MRKKKGSQISAVRRKLEKTTLNWRHERRETQHTEKVLARSAYQRRELKEFKQTYVNYVRTGRPLYKKNTWRSAKYSQSACFNETRMYLFHALQPPGCFATCRTSTKHCNRQTSYLSDQRPNHVQGWLTSVRRSCWQHPQAKHVALRWGHWQK